MRALALMLKTLWSPAAAFREIRDGGAGPWVPMLMFVAFGVASVYLLTSRVDMGEVLTREIQRSPQAGNMSQEQLAEMREGLSNSPWVIVPMYALSSLSVVATFVTALVYYLIFLVLGSRSRFLAFWSVTVFAFTPTLVASVAGIGVMYTIPPSAFSLGQMNVLSAAVFMDPAAEAGALYALAQAVSVTTIWILALLTIGYGVLLSKPIDPAARAVIVVIPWLVVVAARVAPAWIF